MGASVECGHVLESKHGLNQEGDCFHNTKINTFYCNGRTVILWNSIFEKIIYFHGTLFLQNMQKQPPEVFYIKKVFLEILENSQKKTYARVFFS